MSAHRAENFPTIIAPDAKAEQGNWEGDAFLTLVPSKEGAEAPGMLAFTPEGYPTILADLSVQQLRALCTAADALLHPESVSAQRVREGATKRILAEHQDGLA